MKQSEEFEWCEFNNLADSYINQSNEAKQRTGVSRYYYGTFCTTRDFLNENDIFLNEKSKQCIPKDQMFMGKLQKSLESMKDSGRIILEKPSLKN